jgi:putative restriction endonuclease
VVRIFVGVTDKNWFDFLSAQQPDEVNFWAPSGRTNFKALMPGELFLFKLHAPDNYIVGGGVFSHASNLPLSLAWEAFGSKNGVATLPEMRRRIGRYRSDDAADARVREPVVGCRILTSPFFWPREQWIAVPASWSQNIVVGKGYSTDETDGAMLWGAVMERSSHALAPANDGDQRRLGKPVLVQPRLGQGAFRVLITDNYDRRCAVSGERTLPILDAAHIRSFSDGGPHEGSNGLLLRTDIHKLFDLGYVTIDQDRKFLVSHRLKSDFDNGKHYYDLHGTEIRSPLLPSALPSVDALHWHRENRYLG